MSLWNIFVSSDACARVFWVCVEKIESIFDRQGYHRVFLNGISDLWIISLLMIYIDYINYIKSTN